MKKLPILLIGLLSMLFAEVFSGASQIWFISIWGLLIILPLYLLHIVFLVYLAFRFKKTSLTQLYFFGVIFGLYEALITKVLWAGYMGETGPAMGTILGLATLEFPILVFFWHPIMSFIIPILVYQLMTGNILVEHNNILMKSGRKNFLIIIYLIIISIFIANGNKYDYISANVALIGSIMLVIIAFVFSKKESLEEVKKNTSIIAVNVCLIILYSLTFILMLPERIPRSLMPYISIAAFYILSIVLLYRSKNRSLESIRSNSNHYNNKSLTLFSLLLIVSINLAIVCAEISTVILSIAYFGLIIVGIILFIINLVKIILDRSPEIKDLQISTDNIAGEPNKN